MKTRIFILFVCVAAHSSFAQGVFGAVNPNASTRLGSLDGPLAGTNILGLFFAGALPESLTPIGTAQPHSNGRVTAGSVAVPGIPANEYAYVQLIAWDSILWGTDFAAVPSDQIGRTDTVTVRLTTGVFPDIVISPHFNQPAIVPIPEPSTWLLAMLGTAGLACIRRRRR